jgi:hypothetical protein
MIRTPARPLDVTQLFPELTGYAGTATRLHPRPGQPSIADSSVGGPLLWPAAEAWPVCTDADTHYVFQLHTPATVHRSRAVYAAAQRRADETGSRYALTDQERAALPDTEFSEPRHLLNQPIPLVAVAQLYRKDVPDFAGPDDADLLQVLWCPLDHPDEGYNPRVRIYWRRSTDVDRPLAAAPEPPVVNESYLPTACTVTPEQVREYPYRGLLPSDLEARIRAWQQQDADGLSYQRDLSLAPGWKVGGFANWSLTDPYPMNCTECGAPMALLFTADSGEWDGPDDSWRPAREPANTPVDPTDVVIGRGYSLYVFQCPVSFDHPPATAMQ